MEIEEFIRMHNYRLNYTVVGTDISTKVLTIAKEAVYTEANVDTIPFEGFKKRYFDPANSDNSKYRVKPFIKNRIKLGTFNLMSRNYNVPGPFDIIFCRNVLIYFERDKQKYIIENLLKKNCTGRISFPRTFGINGRNEF